MAKGLWVSDTKFQAFNKTLSQEIATRSIWDGSFYGLFNMLPDPDPVLNKLGESILVYKQLLADEEVKSAISLRNSGVKSLDWRIEMGDDATEKEMALCKRALKNLERNKFKEKDLVSQSLNPIYWGYSVFEIIWEKVGREWLPKRVQEKPREWFYFDEKNRLWFKPQDIADEILISGDDADPKYKYKFILLQNEPTYLNPYGDKALSRCFWPVSFKRGGWRFYTIFVEKYGMPYLVGKQPRGAGEEDAKKLISKLAAMVHDAVAVIPDDSSVDILDKGASGSSNALYKDYINQANMAIQKAILLNALTTQTHEKGGYSQVEGGLDILNILSFEDRAFPEELFDELFQYVCELNSGSGKYPVYRAFEEDEVKTDLANRDLTISQQGVRFTPVYYERKYNLKQDEFVITGTTKEPNSTTPAMQHVAAEFAEDDLERNKNLPSTKILTNELLQDQMEKLLEPVIQLIREGKDESVLKTELAEIFPEIDDSEIIATLQKLTFIAGLQAVADEQEADK